MFVVYCEKHRPETVEGETLGERLLRIATQAVDGPDVTNSYWNCPDCKVKSMTVMCKPTE